ncbi:hypothetical protein [Rhizobacter sp. Root29]
MTTSYTYNAAGHPSGRDSLDSPVLTTSSCWAFFSR